MSIYAVGDIQGCYAQLEKLLDSVAFDPGKDELWSTGDIVNRGPESLSTMRFLYALGDACTIVLGNHDLHLLAVAHGNARMKRSDTLQEILDAPDAEALLQWLRFRPLIHHAHNYTLVHAGIPPQWSIEKSLALAQEVETALRGDGYLAFLKHMYGNQPDTWHDDISGHDRLRLITNYLTRMRFCDREGCLDLENKKGPETAKKGTFPWFEVPGRLSVNDNIIFGHWASLHGECHTPHVYSLDTGCVWGGKLTMMRLEDNRIFSAGAEP